MTVTTRAHGALRLAWSPVVGFSEAAALAVLEPLGASQVSRWRALAATRGSARADEFVTGRMLLAHLIDVLAPGTPATVSSTCAVCGGHHGAPRAERAPLVLSVASAHGFVVAAAAPASVAEAIGVDVEPRGGGGPLPGLERLFPRGGPDALEWTRIEAVLKADGRGLTVPPEDVVFAPVRGATDASSLLAGGATASVPGGAGPIEVATLADEAVPDGFVVSVAAIAAVRSAP